MKKIIYAMLLSVVAFNLVGCDKGSKQDQEKAFSRDGLAPMEIPDTGKAYVPVGQEASDALEAKAKK